MSHRFTYLICCIGFIFSACTFVSSRSSEASESKAETPNKDFKRTQYPYIDFHRHILVDWQKDSTSWIKDLPNYSDSVPSLFISDGYSHRFEDVSVKPESARPYGSDVVKNHPVTLRNSFSNHLSTLLQKHTNAFGLCGTQLQWTDLKEFAEYCLSLPKMIGFKLHLAAQMEHLAPELEGADFNIKKLELLSSILNEKGGIILIHFERNGQIEAFDKAYSEAYTTKVPFVIREQYQSEKDIELEVKALLQVVVNFPKVKFIIAHSGQSYVSLGFYGLRMIGDYYKSHPTVVRNVFTDTSTVLNNRNTRFYIYDPNVISDVYRAFDINYVLFGTDDSSVDLFDPRLFNFSEEEIAKIFLKNGKALFNNLGISTKTP